MSYYTSSQKSCDSLIRDDGGERRPPPSSRPKTTSSFTGVRLPCVECRNTVVKKSKISRHFGRKTFFDRPNVAKILI